MQNFVKTQKCLNLEPKNSILGFIGQEFRKIYCDMKSAPSNLPICKISREKQKLLNLGQKMRYLCILGWNLKTILSYLKSLNLSNCKSLPEKKLSKFGTKNGYFWYFSAKIKKEKLFPCLKLAHLNLLNCKIWWNNENA